MASFYGNITDTGRAYFQFDKIFASRRDMDEAAAAGEDGIFPGRFVLVKYDPEINTFFSWQMLPGYKSENSEDNKIYADATCLQPYIYCASNDFVLVEEKKNADWSYYFNSSKAPLANEDDFNMLESYYCVISPENNNKIKNYLVLMDSSRIIKVINKDNKGNIIGFTGYQIDEDNRSGYPVNHWKIITENANLGSTSNFNYIINYQNDYVIYHDAPGFDIRGYDATVWEKIYTDGKGQFIKVANLNGMVPSLEIVADAPSVLPQAPYLDAVSSDTHYRLHMPSNWGFQIKNAEINQETQLPILSDEIIDNIPKEIYFNMSGNNIQHRNYDNITQNEILITPTGESGNTYYNNSGQTITQDMLELSVHIPAIGNMLSNGYDLIYGYNNENNLRYTDIKWYDGQDVADLKENGDVTLGGKTKNLSTLAGTLNIMHDTLGQIISERSLSIEDSEVEQWENNLIYKVGNNYYRKGKVYTIEDWNDYYFKYLGIIAEDDFKANKYYLKKTGIVETENWQYNSNNFDLAIEYNAQDEYYIKTLKDRYTAIDLLQFQYDEQNQPIKYYKKENGNYLCDNIQNPYPTEGMKYFSLDGNRELGEIAFTEKQFQQEFAIDQYYYKDIESDNYLLERTGLDLNKNYYNLNKPATSNNNQQQNKGLIYRPNLFFKTSVQNTGNVNFTDLEIATESNPNFMNNRYFFVKYQRQDIGYDPATGKWNIAWIPSTKTEIFQNSAENIDKEYVFLNLSNPIDYSKIYFVEYENGVLKPISFNSYNSLYKIIDKTKYNFDETFETFSPSLSGDTINNPYLIPREYFVYNNIPNPIASNELYTRNVYYIKNSNDDYLLSSDSLNQQTTYYQKDENYIFPVDEEFYVPDKYYYIPDPTEPNVYILAEGNYLQNTQYFTKIRLYVKEDTAGICPYGYEWNDFAEYIPSTITLYSKTEKYGAVELKGLYNGQGSINGMLLNLNKVYNLDDEETRDKNSFKGYFNQIKDILYQIRTLKPGHLLYVNDFGQIESSNITINQLKNLINNS